MANLPAELGPNEIYRACDAAALSFETTADLPDLTEIIGQERAVSSVEFGMGIDSDGYNIFAVGPMGTGKTSHRLRLPQAGGGLAARSRRLDLRLQLRQTLRAERHPHARRQGAGLPQGHGEARRGSSGGHHPGLRERGVREAEAGHRPAGRGAAGGQAERAEREGRVAGLHHRPHARRAGLRPQDARRRDRCPARPTRRCRRRSRRVSTTASKPSTRNCRRSCGSSARTSAPAATPCGSSTRRSPTSRRGISSTRPASTGATCPRCPTTCSAVLKDVVENADDFKKSDDEAPAMFMGMPISPRQKGEGAFRKYRINVVVDNSDLQGAPVITETNPVLQNLVGRVEHQAQFGALFTDFTMIKAGRAAQGQRWLPGPGRPGRASQALRLGRPQADPQDRRDPHRGHRPADGLRHHGLARPGADPLQGEDRAHRRAVRLLPALRPGPGLPGAVQGQGRLRLGGRSRLRRTSSSTPGSSAGWPASTSCPRSPPARSPA